MKRTFSTYLSILILAGVAFIAAPAAHAQQQPPYPPPPYPPQPYPPPYPPPPYPPQQYQYEQPRAPKPQHDVADFAVSATRQLTQPITPSYGPASVWTTDSTGLLAQFRAHPMEGTAVELNYQYTKLTEQYSSPVGGGVVVNTSVPTKFQEVTGAFLFESHMRGIRPFLALGGGSIDFSPTVAGMHNQWRGTGLAELGFDLPAGRHFGVRVQGRGLFYRAPNFNNAALQSRTWVATVEPTAGLYVRW